MKTFFQVFSLVFAVLFIWAAVMQWNDPDPFLWYLVYGLPAILSILFFLGRLSPGIPLIVSLLYLVGMVFAWPEQFAGFTGSMASNPNIEKGREAFGLLLIAVVLMTYALRLRYVGRKA